MFGGSGEAGILTREGRHQWPFMVIGQAGQCNPRETFARIELRQFAGRLNLGEPAEALADFGCDVLIKAGIFFAKATRHAGEELRQ